MYTYIMYYMLLYKTLPVYMGYVLHRMYFEYDQLFAIVVLMSLLFISGNCLEI